MTRPLPRLALALIMTLLFVGIAHANDPATRSAKRHFERGEKLFALGKFDEALDEYQLAYDAAPFPAFLFNIGQCHRNLGDYESAIFSFKKYLKLEPDAENRPQVEDYIDKLEAEQAKGNSRKLGLIEQPDDPPPTATPIYKKWWFWTGVVAVGAVGGIGIYAATRTANGPPETTLGNIVFTK